MRYPSPMYVALQTYCTAVGEKRSSQNLWQCPQSIAFSAFCSRSHP